VTLSTRSIVVAGLLIAVAAVLAITGLGYFPVANITAEATIMHVPAIIGGVLAGPVVGLIVGLVFGINAYIRFIGLPFFVDQPVWVPVLVLFVPRLLIGVVAAWSYLALRRSGEVIALAVAACLGTLTNTVLVLGFAILLGLLPAATVVAAVPQAIFEMVLAAIITVAVVVAWKRIDTGRGSSV
jgi:uncharacterized membrane protein